MPYLMRCVDLGVELDMFYTLARLLHSASLQSIVELLLSLHCFQMDAVPEAIRCGDPEAEADREVEPQSFPQLSCDGGDGHVAVSKTTGCWWEEEDSQTRPQ